MAKLEPPFKPSILYDYIRNVDGGHVNGIDPLIIQRNQLAFFRNGTVRGTFPTHRPAYQQIPLNFNGAPFQGAFENAFFQGAGYYKPDFGLESIICQIAGRLFQITISGQTASVSEISISGDTNSSTLPQAWMWQAEKWMIIQDGQHLPVFFDGNTSRRSLGAATQVPAGQTITGGPYNMPAQGSTIAGVTLSGAFSGPYNVPLTLTDPNGTHGLVEVVGTGGAFNGYGVTLQNPGVTAGIVEANGSQVTVANLVCGTTGGAYGSGSSTIQLGNTTPVAFPVGTPVIVPFVIAGNQIGTLQSVFGPPSNVIIIKLQTPIPHGDSVASGANVYTPNGNSVLVGLLNQAYTAPTIGTSSQAFLDRAYAGALPIAVFINTHLYQLTAVTSNGPSTSITILNLTYPQGTGNFNTTTGSTLFTVPELPAGRMGCYGLGNSWQALTDGRSFIAGDQVGSSSGSPTYQKRDAVLKVSQNTLLNGGGSFIVPGQVGDIRAMLFASTIDTSLGQGPLIVCTPTTVFSCTVPALRTDWQNVTSPILTESMKGGGGMGQNSTVPFNSDIMMRALVGIRSYIQGRRDFDVWGNVPISREVDPTLATDDPSLLQFTSGVEFDNRYLLTTSPVQSVLGTYWTELVALNADAISSLRGKAPSVYDGIWDGLNVLQLVKGNFNGVERCFALCVSQDLTKIQLWEILKSADPTFQDNNTTPITWEYETPALNFYENDPRRRDFFCLKDGEIRVDRLDKTLYEQNITVLHVVTIQSFFRSEQSVDWVPWHNDALTFDPNNPEDLGYRYAIGFGEPSETVFDEINNLPLRHGSTFQFRFIITGHCRIVLHRFKANTVPELDFAAVKD